MPGQINANHELICNGCSANITSRIVVRQTNGQRIAMCDVCGKGFAECKICGAWQASSVMQVVGNSGSLLLCRACVAERYGSCSVCGQLQEHGRLTRQGTVRLCESCQREMTFCECGAVIHRNSEEECRACRANKLHELNTIYEAGLKPRLTFFGQPEPHYGMEVEVDNFEPDGSIDDCVNEVGDILEKSGRVGFMKSDGSLSLGFEIVSMPHSVEAWRKQTWLEDVCETVKSYGGRSFETGSCGVHIHRSRGDLNHVALTKLILLFVRLQPYFERVAQRRENGYCSYAYFQGRKPGVPMTEAAPKLKGQVVYKAVKNGESGLMNRYFALNVTNHKTVECRIFRGTLNTASIMAYLEFFHYVVQFIKDGSFTFTALKDMPQKELWETLEEYLISSSRVLLEYFRRKEITAKAEKRIIREEKQREKAKVRMGYGN